jgi:uncharacterized membrane protein SpoIIM required for sporulation
MSAPVKRHPFRAIFGGIFFGFGLALLLINFKVIALGTTTPYIVFLIGVILGVMIAFFAPPRPKGSHRETVPAGD